MRFKCAKCRNEYDSETYPCSCPDCYPKKDYKLGDAGNAKMAAIEKFLFQLDFINLASACKMSESDRAEMFAISDEGLASFQRASEGVAPLQKFILGVQYTAAALKEWRERGPI